MECYSAIGLIGLHHIVPAAKARQVANIAIATVAPEQLPLQSLNFRPLEVTEGPTV